MKAFKLMSILAGFMALAMLTSCAEKVEDPSITIEGESTLNLTKEKATVKVKILSNRDWGMRFVGNTPDWIVAEPNNGKASKNPTEVTVTVTENTGANREASVEFYTGVATAMLTIKQAGPKGESDGVESLTVQQFINRADKTTYYRLTGKVSSFQTGTNSSGKDWMQFNLTDDSGTILVYGFAGGQYEAWSGRIKNGGTVILQGQYEYYSQKNQHEVVNTTIESFTAGEEQTDITETTVANFISTASSTVYYRLTGTVSAFQTGKNNSGKDWMQFNLTDDTGTILVYGFESGQFEEWSTKIKDNGTVTLVGTYEYYDPKSQHEVMNAKIESFTEGAEVLPVTATVAEAIAAANGAKLILEEVKVAGKSTMGIVVTDGTSDVYVYFDTKAGETVPAVAVGDKVKVQATKSTYNGLTELTKATVTKLSSDAMTYPEPKDLTTIATTYESAVTEYVKLTGTLSIDKDKGYYNLAIPGVSSDTKQGSISGPLPELGIDALEGNEITVWGYFLGFASSGKFINIMATDATLADPDAKYCRISPASIKAKADDTSASISISSNADWTVACDNDAFTVSPASGNGDATVTVSFSANEGTEPRVANITVACVDAGIAAVVVLTQAKPASGDATVIAIDFTVENADLPQGSAAGLQDGTYTLEGYQFIMHAADKFSQSKSGDKYFFLIGKANSYIQLPVVEGKALTKVEFLTGAGASENVIVDVAKSDGTLLKINESKLLKGKTYTWDIPGEVGVAYRLVVTNAYNAQFQTLTLTYE